MNTRTWLLLATVLLAGSLAVLLVGSPLLGLDRLWAVLSGSATRAEWFIVVESRLPKMAVGVLAGVALGIAGTIFQDLLGNPLASPDVLGINLGAAAAAVLAMIVFQSQGWGLIGAAAAGALLAALFVYLLSVKGTGHTLILSGLGVGIGLNALIVYLLTRSDARMVGDVYRWLVGSLNSATYPRLWVLLAALLGLVPLVAGLRKRLRLLELGDELASGLGVRTPRARLALVLCAAGLCAAAVSVVGPLAFVAFLAGPLTRLLNRGRSSLAGSGAVGACLVILGEVAAQVVFPVPLPAGVVTGGLGAPFLAALLIRQRVE